MDFKEYWMLIIAITLMIEVAKMYITADVHPKWISLAVAVILSAAYVFTPFFDGEYLNLLISFAVSVLFYDYLYKVVRDFIISKIDKVGKVKK